MVRGIKSANFLFKIIKQRTVEKSAHTDIETVAQLLDGTPTGGTAYTVKYAYQRNKEIIVIDPNTMERKVIPPRLQEL